jgi:hypothetical protein
MEAKAWLRDCAISTATAVAVVGVWLLLTRQPIDPPPTPAEAALARVIPEVDLRGLTFEQAIARLEELGGVPIEVQWDNLRWIGASSASGQIRMHRVTLHQAMMLAFQEYRSWGVLEFYPDGDRIVFDAPAAAMSREVYRLYDVRELLADAAEVYARRGSWAPSPSYDGDIALYPFVEINVDLASGEILASIITGLIEPDSWQEFGGVSGHLLVAGTWLAVRHTPEVHRRVQALLRHMQQPIPPTNRRAP